MWGDDESIPWGCVIFIVIIVLAIAGPWILQAMGLL